MKWLSRDTTFYGYGEVTTLSLSGPTSASKADHAYPRPQRLGAGLVDKKSKSEGSHRSTDKPKIRQDGQP